MNRHERKDFRLTRRALLGGLAGGGLLLLARPGHAQSLSDMLASGKVGEGFDGFLRARDASAQGFVNQVNDKRFEIYSKRASETGQAVEVVGRIYAKELYEKAAAGTWFLLENGSWIQK